jgi:phenylalanyl-tRNA synthetase beta chain
MSASFALRRAIAALGYQETINFSFVDVRSSRTLPVIPLSNHNPISSQMSVMRSSLLGSAAQVLGFSGP